MDTATIHNSTFSHNSAGEGGGLYNEGNSFTVSNSTIFSNTADAGGGIFDYTHNSSTVDIDNTILAKNDNGSDCGGAISNIRSNGHNLDSDGSCSLSEPSDISNADPLLGPLQDNGGSTLTHELLEGSPAIDAGNTLLDEDQRGTLRPQGSATDIGAFEKVLVIEVVNTFDLFLPLITR